VLFPARLWPLVRRFPLHIFVMCLP